MGVDESCISAIYGCCVRRIETTSIPPFTGIDICYLVNSLTLLGVGVDGVEVWGRDYQSKKRSVAHIHKNYIRPRTCRRWIGEVVQRFASIPRHGYRDGWVQPLEHSVEDLLVYVAGFLLAG